MRAIAKGRRAAVLDGKVYVRFRFCKFRKAKVIAANSAAITEAKRTPTKDLDVKAAAEAGDACLAYFREHGKLPV